MGHAAHDALFALVAPLEQPRRQGSEKSAGVASNVADDLEVQSDIGTPPDFYFMRRISDQFKEKTGMLQERRLTHLEQLTQITNCTSFKKQSSGATGDPEAEIIKDTLNKMVLEDEQLSLSELLFVKRLGEGGFAFVDLYEHVTPSGTVVQYAVKEMKDSYQELQPSGDWMTIAVDEEEYTKFYAEAVLLKALRHKHVVGCYGCVREPVQDGEKRPAPKLLQEFCPDGSLLDQLKKGQYSAKQALIWLKETALGMAYLHEEGGMHRDLKPENILLKDGRVKVADFGLFKLQASLVEQSKTFNWARKQRASFLQVVNDAQEKQLEPTPPRRIASCGLERAPSLVKRAPSLKRALSRTNRSRRAAGSLQTSTQFTKGTGTARYMAPECHHLNEDQHYTNKCDIFSFAIMAYELLARRRAYEDTMLTMEQVSNAVFQKSLRPKLPKLWSVEIQDLFERMWNQDAEKRMPFNEIAAELESLVSGADACERITPSTGPYGLSEPRRGVRNPASSSCTIL